MLPAQWTEDTARDTYDPNAFVFFENPESCLLGVIIAPKSAGATADNILKSQREALQKRVTEMQFTETTQWGSYNGRGYDFQGKAQGLILMRGRTLAFENDTSVCFIMETATLADYQTYARDFELIRQTFRLKP